MKHASEGFTVALKPRADVTRSSKQGYQWLHKKGCVLQISKINSKDIASLLRIVNVRELFLHWYLSEVFLHKKSIRQNGMLVATISSRRI